MGNRQERDGRAAAVLMYHDIVDSSRPASGDRDPVYKVELADFEAQMECLMNGGYNVLSLERFREHQLESQPLPPRCLVLTFDDGHCSNFEYALPVLARYGFKAEFFLTVEYLGRPEFLGWVQARALVEAGMAIGSHLVHHAYLSDLSIDAARSELVESRRLLSENLATPVQFLAPPGGRINPALEKVAAEAGYLGICGSRVGLNRLDHNPFRLQRIPIVRTTTLDSFRAFVDQRSGPLLAQRIRFGALGLVKRVLGNQRYDQVRQRLLSRRQVG